MAKKGDITRARSVKAEFDNSVRAGASRRIARFLPSGSGCDRFPFLSFRKRTLRRRKNSDFRKIFGAF